MVEFQDNDIEEEKVPTAISSKQRSNSQGSKPNASSSSSGKQSINNASSHKSIKKSAGTT